MCVSLFRLTVGIIHSWQKHTEKSNINGALFVLSRNCRVIVNLWSLTNEIKKTSRLSTFCESFGKCVWKNCGFCITNTITF